MSYGYAVIETSGGLVIIETAGATQIARVAGTGDVHDAARMAASLDLLTAAEAAIGLIVSGHPGDALGRLQAAIKQASACPRCGANMAELAPGDGCELCEPLLPRALAHGEDHVDVITGDGAIPLTGSLPLTVEDLATSLLEIAAFSVADGRRYAPLALEAARERWEELVAAACRRCHGTGVVLVADDCCGGNEEAPCPRCGGPELDDEAGLWP